MRLLCYQWLEGSIPRDPKKLANLCGVDPNYFLEDIWPSLDEVFDVIDERLVNPKLDRIRIATEEKVSKFREAGKRGADKRWNKEANDPPNSPPNSSHSHRQSQSHTDDNDSTGVSKSGEITKENADSYEALMFSFGFGHHKALNIVEKINPTIDDLNDWLKYEEVKGTRLTRHHMKRYKNPRDVPEEKEGTDTKRKTFQQMEEDDYAKKKAELEKEMEDGQQEVAG